MLSLIKIEKLIFDLEDSEIEKIENKISIINKEIEKCEISIENAIKHNFKDVNNIYSLQEEISEFKDKKIKLNDTLESGKTFESEFFESDFPINDIVSIWNSNILWNSSLGTITTGSSTSWGTITTGSSWGTTNGYSTTGLWQTQAMSQSSYDNILNRMVIVKTISNDNILEYKNYIVIDDVFESYLGQLYLYTSNQSILYLNRVIEINELNDFDEESKLSKWFTKNNQNYIRGKKLNKIIN